MSSGVDVLVVEDDTQMLRFLRASLTSRGFRVLDARTSAEASIVASSHRPAIILLDLGLPDGDGIELTRRLREWTPIIVVSARVRGGQGRCPRRRRRRLPDQALRP